MTRVPALLMLCFTVASSLPAAVMVSADFETDSPDKPPTGWRLFRTGTVADVRVRQLPDNRALCGRRSASGGLVALSLPLAQPAKRVLIEFDFAFSAGHGRSLNLWTHEPNGQDASQFNLAVQNGALRQFDGATRSWETITRKLKPSPSVDQPVWHRLSALLAADSAGIEYRVSAPGETKLPGKPTAVMPAYRTGLPVAAIDFVSGTRLAKDAWYLVDNLVVKTGADLPAPAPPDVHPPRFPLWTGPALPAPERIPFVPGMVHHTIHRAQADGYKFLHGAAIIDHEGVLYANWANSLVDENSPTETLQGRRSHDGGRTWSDLEIIAPGFANQERHSHGILMTHRERLWTICARFGRGTKGQRFDGLCAEAFVLEKDGRTWTSHGIVMTNCWPYDEPVRMANGNFITGGQSRDGHPVVAVSQGDDILHWDSVLIPFPERLSPSFAETTVLENGSEILAVIRGGRGVAWISRSRDYGNTWTEAVESTLPMPRAKAYFGRLSTGQPYLVSNLRNRDTLIISVGNPGSGTLHRSWRIRHGRSEAPRFKGHAKGPQWSYPYAHEADGKLHVVYSIGKEDCGLSILPVASLRTTE